MSNARVHGRNLLMNWFAQFANLAVLFFLSPFILHRLGQVEFGLWSLLTVMTGYMGVLDLGVKASTGRHIALYLGKGDMRAIDETIRTSLGFFSGLGLVAVAVGAGIGFIFPHVFDTVPAEYHTLAQWLVPFLAVSVWLGAIGSVFSSVLSSHDRFDLTRRVDLTVLALRATATVTLLSLGYGIVALAFVSVGSQLLGLVGNYYFAKRIYPKLRVWPVLFNRFRLRELLGYGVLAVVSTISLQIIGRTDLVIAGAAISVSAVAVYSVGASLVYYASNSLTNVSRTLFPDIQRSSARGEHGSVRWLYLRAARIQMVFGVLAFVGMFVFAEPFIRLWMGGPNFGDESIHQAALVMQVLALSKLPILFRGVSVPVLNAMGRVRVTAILTAAEATLNLVLSLVFVLVLNWGLLGIAAGTLVARVLAGTFISPWYACAKTGASWPGYLLRIGGSCVLSSAAFAAVCLVVRHFAYPDTWIVFFVEVGIASLIWPAIAWVILVPSNDRQRVWRRLGLSGGGAPAA